MNFFKNMLIAALFCTIGSINSKIIRYPEPKTFSELVNFVKTTPIVWDTSTLKLSDHFITRLTNGAKAAGLKQPQLDMLINMTSYRAPFGNNPEQNKQIISNYTKQKKSILKQHYSSMSQEPIVASDISKISTPPIKTTQKDEIMQFIQELVKANEETLQNTFFKSKSPYLDMAQCKTILSFITKALKEKYITREDRIGAETILIDELKKILPTPKVGENRWDIITKDIHTYLLES